MHKDEPEDGTLIAVPLNNNDGIYRYPCGFTTEVRNAIHGDDKGRISLSLPWNHWTDIRTDMHTARESVMKGVPNFQDSRVEIIKDTSFHLTNSTITVKDKNKNISMHMSKIMKYQSKYQPLRLTGKNNVPTGVLDYEDLNTRHQEDTTHGFRNRHPPMRKLYCVIMAHPVIPGPAGQSLPEEGVMDSMVRLTEQMRDDGKGVLPLRHLGKPGYKDYYKLSDKPKPPPQPKPKRKKPIRIDPIEDDDLGPWLPAWYDKNDGGGKEQAEDGETEERRIQRLYDLEIYRELNLEKAVKEARAAYNKSEAERIAAEGSDDDLDPDDLEPDDDDGEGAYFDPSFSGNPFAWIELRPKISFCFRNNRDSRPRLS